jgi:hypothetical protein
MHDTLVFLREPRIIGDKKVKYFFGHMRGKSFDPDVFKLSYIRVVNYIDYTLTRVYVCEMEKAITLDERVAHKVIDDLDEIEVMLWRWIIFRDGGELNLVDQDSKYKPEHEPQKLSASEMHDPLTSILLRESRVIDGRKVRAITGSIDKVRFDPDVFKLSYIQLTNHVNEKSLLLYLFEMEKAVTFDKTILVGEIDELEEMMWDWLLLKDTGKLSLVEPENKYPRQL